MTLVRYAQVSILRYIKVKKNSSIYDSRLKLLKKQKSKYAFCFSEFKHKDTLKTDRIATIKKQVLINLLVVSKIYNEEPYEEKFSCTVLNQE